MKNKKMTTILALVLVLCVLFSACGGKTAVEEPVTNEPEVSNEPAKEEPKQNTEYPVVSWYLMASDQYTRDQELVEEAVNEILREKVGCEVKFYFLEGATYKEKMNVMMNAGEEIDIMAGGSYTGIPFATAYRTGSLLDVSDLLEEYGQAILAKSDDRVWTAVTKEDGIYAIPSQMPWASEQVVSFRADLVEKYAIDIDAVKTIEDLEPILETLKTNESGVVPLMTTSDRSVPRVFIRNAAVGNYSTVVNNMVAFNYETQQMESVLDQQSAVDVYRVVHDYYQKGYIAKDALSIVDTMLEARDPKYAVTYVTDEFSDGEKSSALIGVDSVETLLGRDEITTDSMIVVLNYISNTSKQPENAMKVLNEVWSNPELSNLIAYGIEGVHYTVTANAGTDHPSVEPKTGDEISWTIYHNFIGPLFDQWDSPWNSTEALQGMEERNTSSPASQLLGFTFNQEPVKNQIAELEAVTSEIFPVLMCGAMSDFDAYIEEAAARMEAAGLDDVIAEAQRQYEEWVSSNQ